jgi:uncharacterized protein YdbL (DUF1318 family)
MTVASYRSILFIVALFATALLVSIPADARPIDDYRAQGVIAERFDGYVEIRAGDAPAAARQLVDEVNGKRRALYEQRATEQGVSASEVGKVYAPQIMEDAPGGTFFRQPNGSYIQK